MHIVSSSSSLAMRCSSIVAMALALSLAVLSVSAAAHAAPVQSGSADSTLHSMLRLMVDPLSSATPIPRMHASKVAISGSNLTLEQQSAFIASRYHSSSKVAEVRDRVPRWGRTKDFAPAESDYQQMLINQVGVGAAGFIITLFIWIGYGVAQCCCVKPNPAGYTRGQRLVPLITGSLCALLVVAFCIIGAYYTEEFDKQIIGSKGLTVSAKNVVTHVNSFFTDMDLKLVDTRGQVAAVAGPGGDIQTIISNFTNPRAQMTPFLALFTEFGRNVGARNPIRVYQYDHGANPSSDNPIEYTSTFFSDTQTTVNDVAQSISDAATPAFDTIDTTKGTASNEVVDAETAIQAQITDAQTEVNKLRVDVVKYNADVDDYNDKVKEYEDYRRKVVLAFFLLPIAMVILWFVLTVGLRKEGGTKCVVCGLFPVGMMMWLLFLIHLPFAVLVADSCNYLDGVDPYLYRETIFDAKVANTLTACLAQQNLLVPLGVADQLDFGETIVFPVVTADGLLNVTALDEINSEVQALNRSTFTAYDANAKQTALTQLNGLTSPDSFTFDTIEANCNPDNYPSNSGQVRSLKNTIVTALRTETAMDSLLTEIKTNMTVVMTSFNGLKQSTINLLDNLNALQGTITPLLDSAQAVIDSSFCSPLDDDYLQLKQTFCERMIVSIGGLAMASFFAAMFLGLLNFSGWFLVHRLQHGVEQVASWGGAAVAAGGKDGVEMIEAGSPAYGAGSQQQVASPSGMMLSPSGMAADPYAQPNYQPNQPMQYNPAHVGGSNPDQVALQFAHMDVQAAAPMQSADPRYRGASTI